MTVQPAEAEREAAIARHLANPMHRDRTPVVDPFDNVEPVGWSRWLEVRDAQKRPAGRRGRRGARAGH